MKIKAFTLPEILIALTVIGIVAAITIPAIVNNAPNRDKAQFLKIYDGISTAANEILENPAYYYGSSTQYNHCMGYACDSAAQDRAMLANNVDYQGIGKHQCLISDILNVDRNSTCDPADDHNEFYPIAGIKVTMDTKDVNHGNYITNIVIDLGDNHRVTEGSPRAYYLYLDNWGRVTPGNFNNNVTVNDNQITVTPDRMAQAYIDNRLRLNNKREDLEIARNIRENSYTVTIPNYGATER